MGKSDPNETPVAARHHPQAGLPASEGAQRVSRPASLPLTCRRVSPLNSKRFGAGVLPTT